MEADNRINQTSVYVPLAHDQIRLLRLYQDNEGRFIGEMDIFPLNNCPPFFTASYVWGEKIYSERHITFQNGELLVLMNLEPFLEMVTTHANFSPKTWWWIDSLCINQTDLQERSAQVAIMEDIYKAAKTVIIWLGDKREENNNCIGAIPFLKQLKSIRGSLEAQKTLRTHLRTSAFSHQWQSIAHLLSRKWFTRAWTLQEFILPSEVKFYCGNESIGRSSFKSAMYSIWLCDGHDNTIMPRKAFDSPWNRRRIHQWYAKDYHLPLVATLAYVSDHQATDPVDRIYSIRGLLSKRDRHVVGQPDYRLKLETVFARLVEVFWKEYGILDIICFTHIFNRYSGPGAEQRVASTLPSWAPDWRALVPPSPVPLMASQPARHQIGNFGPIGPLSEATHAAEYDACGLSDTRPESVSFLHDLKELRCEGVILDVIDGLGGLEGLSTRCASLQCKEFGHEFVQTTSTLNLQDMTGHLPSGQPERIQTGLRLTESLSRCLSLDRGDKYLTSKSLPKYIFDLQGLCLAALFDAPESVDPLFLAWWEQNRNICIQGKSLLDVVTESMVVPNKNHAKKETCQIGPAQPKRIESIPIGPSQDSSSHTTESNSFLSRFHYTTCKMSRRLLITNEGLLGMAPCHARKGDVVAIIFGCSIPLVLRRLSTRDAWLVIGECYVDAYMNGEVRREVRRGERVVRQFTLV
ncbi:hypothetical protein GQ43DRAFT_444377 [Delitschia confertaspora ATCC 74209]|uniref:Heterokaryon incompatibility domain-containing protein n=1 Tax=Delitschia confertaspora ATCC 74209 TaxID=1513339 RepID=A0A9P4JDT7_9PLEO|nr:hypothetical protein GQ43DRAFT_444377 [Delitschia confertaspora ATCC 74209]